MIGRDYMRWWSFGVSWEVTLVEKFEVHQWLFRLERACICTFIHWEFIEIVTVIVCGGYRCVWKRDLRKAGATGILVLPVLPFRVVVVVVLALWLWSLLWSFLPLSSEPAWTASVTHTGGIPCGSRELCRVKRSHWGRWFAQRHPLHSWLNRRIFGQGPWRYASQATACLAPSSNFPQVRDGYVWVCRYL